jgi:ABC-type lipoprotein export system ATPase subunit
MSEFALFPQGGRTQAGFVFHFYNLAPRLTARENVTLVTEIVEHPMTAEQALGIVAQLGVARLGGVMTC